MSTTDRKSAVTRIDDSIWFTIFNYADDSDEADRKRGIARFSTTRKYNAEYLNSSEDRIWMYRYRAFMDVYMGQIALLMRLHTVNERQLYFPVTGGRFLLTGEGSPSGRPQFLRPLPGRRSGFRMVLTMPFHRRRPDLSNQW